MDVIILKQNKISKVKKKKLHISKFYILYLIQILNPLSYKLISYTTYKTIVYNFNLYIYIYIGRLFKLHEKLRPLQYIVQYKNFPLQILF